MVTDRFNSNSEEELVHYGTPRHSGRYPWGSGKNPQRNKNFRSRYNELKEKGLSSTEIAESMGMNTAQLRAKVAAVKEQEKKENYARANRLYQKYGNKSEVARIMGVNESVVRTYLKGYDLAESTTLENTRNVLRNRVDSAKYVDVGKGTENWMGVSETKLKYAIQNLVDDEGYEVIPIKVEQKGMSNGNMTTIKVLCPPGTSKKDVYDNKDKIVLVDDYSTDGGLTFNESKPSVKSINSKRIEIVYDEDGGSKKDGVIELRPGVDELSLGNAKYAQVRIGVDDRYYLKGMAVYNDNLPDGIDVRFNTNKTKGTPMSKVFKKMQVELDKDGNPILDKNGEEVVNLKNPFSTTTVKQYPYIGKDGKEHESAINIVGTDLEYDAHKEGTWGNWSKVLASQMLSKQSEKLAKQQLDIAYEQSKAEFNEIMALENPTIKRRLLQSFSEDCDSKAANLKAAALPGQTSAVLLPINSLKDNEIYDPRHENGTQVALIRYPHAGKFEIPVLTVNNKNEEANKVMKQAKDAVGINSNVAARLSGADFDGDTVIVIPNDSGVIKNSSPLKGLVDFNPSTSYPDATYKVWKKGSQTEQTEMGKISNLITDMTLKGASPDELCRAVRHSMVIIDTAKHNLDWKKSYEDNGIKSLKEKYQMDSEGHTGAGTIISRAKSELTINKRNSYYKIDPETGKKIYTDSTDTKFKKSSTKTKNSEDVEIPKNAYKSNNASTDEVDVYMITSEDGNSRTRYEVSKNSGKTKVITYTKEPATQKIKKMDYYDDAYDLMSESKYPMEIIYADYANSMKALANQARKAQVSTPKLKYSSEAAKEYAAEVSELNAGLNKYKKNKPLERQAQLYADVIVKSKMDDNPELRDDTSALKKVKNQALNVARERVKATKYKMDITEKQWEAIQKGAISDEKLDEILWATDLDKVKSYATPRVSRELSPAMKASIQARYNQGYTQAEIADLLGVSVTSVQNVVSE